MLFRSADIWTQSAGFNAYRGENWMQEPCRSCERRTRDYGGCRCQAYHLTGDAAAADPVCKLAPAHGIVERARTAAQAQGRVELTYRSPKAVAAE